MRAVFNLKEGWKQPFYMAAGSESKSLDSESKSFGSQSTKNVP
jgi:hypothetical protein